MLRKRDCCDIKQHLEHHVRVSSFPPLLRALLRLTAQLSWVGGLQLQQLSKDRPIRARLPLLHQGAKQTIRSFLGYHRCSSNSGYRDTA